MQKLLIVGLGDVAQRALPELLNCWEVTVVTRATRDVPTYQNLHIVPFDLDALEWTQSQLNALNQRYDAVVWTAPPNASNTDEHTSRMCRVIAQWLNNGGSWQPKRLVYISTTGVYGDCAGAWVNEKTSLNPQSKRAQARVWDEQAWMSLGAKIGAQVCVLRAPGIYALERLPVQSVLTGMPVMLSDEDSFSNHVHADDLAGALVYAVSCDDDAYVDNPWVINVCDDELILMGRWYVALAKVLGVPEPKYIARAQMQSVAGDARWSFMRESRKVSNAKLHAWGYSLKHPSALEFIEEHQTVIRARYLNPDNGAADV